MIIKSSLLEESWKTKEKLCAKYIQKELIHKRCADLSANCTHGRHTLIVIVTGKMTKLRLKQPSHAHQKEQAYMDKTCGVYTATQLLLKWRTIDALIAGNTAQRMSQSTQRTVSAHSKVISKNRKTASL